LLGKSAGLINQAPTPDKTNYYRKGGLDESSPYRTNKWGLAPFMVMNQIPTPNKSNSRRSI